MINYHNRSKISDIRNVFKHADRTELSIIHKMVHCIHHTCHIKSSNYTKTRINSPKKSQIDIKSNTLKALAIYISSTHSPQNDPLFP